MPPVLQAPLVTRALLLLILLAGVYFFRGFVVPVLAALIIGFASWPLYERLVRACKGNTTLAASLALLVVLLVLVVPLSLALHYAVREASVFVRWLVEANRHGAPVPAHAVCLRQQSCLQTCQNMGQGKETGFHWAMGTGVSAITSLTSVRQRSITPFWVSST